MSFGHDIGELVEKNAEGLVCRHESWQRIRLGDIAKLVNGFAFKSKFFSEQEGAPLVRIRDVVPGRPGTFYNAPVDDPKMSCVSDGEIAIGMDGDFNCRIWKGGKALLNQRVCTLTANVEFYSQKLLAFALPAYLKLINEHTSSVTVKHLSSRTVQDIPLPLPPLSEQHRIVEKIETLFARLDKGEEAVREVQKLLRRYRQSILKSAVTGDLTADWRAEREGELESGADLLARILKTREQNWQGRGKYNAPIEPDTTNLPNLPEGWVWASVDQVLRAGLSNGRSVPDAKETGFPVMRLTALKDGLVDLSERKEGRWTAEEAAPYLVEQGDILVSRGNGSKQLVGRGGLIVDKVDPVAFPDTMIRIPISLNFLSPRWFIQLWNSPLMRSFIENAAKTTAGIYKINQGDIRSFAVPLPPLAEQEEIADAVDEALSKSADLDRLCETELKRSAALHQSILKDAFSGHLVPQDPDDEPASALLERIQQSKKKRK